MNICVLGVMDIHWSYQNLLFWAGIIWHRLLANQIVRCFKLKNLKTIWGIKLIFCFHWSYKNHTIFWIMPENTLGQSVCRIFYFWLVWLVNTGGPLLHCTFLLLLFFSLLDLFSCNKLHLIKSLPNQQMFNKHILRQTHFEGKLILAKLDSVLIVTFDMWSV